MPTYEYRCLKCGYRFERFQAIVDAPLKRCPECNGKIKRLIGSGGGIIFKGSGFFETDYKKPQKNNGDSKKSSSDSKESKCEPNSCETCPADKA